MSIGTSIPTVKGLLVDALSARTWPTGTVVGYEPPRFAEHVEAGLNVFLLNDAVDIDHDVDVFNGSNPVEFEETYELTVVVESVTDTDGGDQRDRDTEAAAMLAEVVDTVASDPTLGHTATAELPQIGVHLAGGGSYEGGRGAGYLVGARQTIDVEVTATIANQT